MAAEQPEPARCPKCGEPTAGVWPDPIVGRAQEPCGCAAEKPEPTKEADHG